MLLLTVRDRLAVSLPVILMALLAAGTWWLVRNTPSAEGARTQAAKRHEPDYSMGRFTTERFGPDGSLRAVIEGQALHHYADTDTVEIDAMHAHGTDDAGRRYQAAALHSVSDSGAVNIQLSGQVNVVREAFAADPATTARARSAAAGRVELSGESLTIDTQAERARSDRPVAVYSEAGEVRANALDYRGDTGQTLLTGRVYGFYLAAPELAASRAAEQPHADAASGAAR